MRKHATTLRKRITLVLVLANMFVLTLYVSGWAFAPSRSHNQDDKKSVVRELPSSNEPIEIGDIKLKSKVVKFDEKFDADETWLRDITLKVKNKGKKTITYLRLDFTFPETSSSGPIMLHQLYLGRRFDSPSTNNREPLRLLPNQSSEVSLESGFEDIKSLVESREPSIGKINKINVRLGEAMFEDDTLYSGGATFKRNPDTSSPRKWVVIRD